MIENQETNNNNNEKDEEPEDSIFPRPAYESHRLAKTLKKKDTPNAPTVEVDKNEENASEASLPSVNKLNLSSHGYGQIMRFLKMLEKCCLPVQSSTAFKNKVQRRLKMTPSYIEENTQETLDKQVMPNTHAGQDDICVVWKRPSNKAETTEICHQKEYVELMDRINIYAQLYVKNRALELKEQREGLTYVAENRAITVVKNKLEQGPTKKELGKRDRKKRPSSKKLLIKSSQY